MNKRNYSLPGYFNFLVFFGILLLVTSSSSVAGQGNMSWPMFLPAIVVQGNAASSCSDSQGFTVCSTSFKNGARLSDKFTLDGENISPQLSWVNAPEGTDAFGLFVYDPDGGDWTHWMVQVPGSVTSLAEGTGEAGGANLPAGSVRSPNSFSGTGTPGAAGTDYDGPYPPIGSGNHRYIFQVYALDNSGQAIGIPASIIGLYSR